MKKFLSVDCCEHIAERLAQGYLFLGKDQGRQDGKGTWRIFGEGEDAAPLSECYLDECSEAITVTELAVPGDVQGLLDLAIDCVAEADGPLETSCYREEVDALRALAAHVAALQREKDELRERVVRAEMSERTEAEMESFAIRKTNEFLKGHGTDFAHMLVETDFPTDLREQATQVGEAARREFIASIAAAEGGTSA